MPAPSAIPPADCRLVVAVRNMGVTENAVSDPVFQNLQDRGSRLEIHVCNPKRDDILVNRPCGTLCVPFDAVGSASVNHLVEIIFAHFRMELYS